MTEMLQPQTGVASRRAAQTALLLLFLSSTFNYLDRTILSVIGQAVKVDLRLSDTELGLLGGLAFAVFYVGLGIPIARIAERYNRVNIIAVGLAVWSAFTALCGAANSFTQMFLFRIGVGIGEAGLNPPAHSLISDYFPASRRSGAFGMYMLSVPVGSLIGAVAGGWLAQNTSWRFAFLVLGLPGLALAVLVKLFLREPPRGLSEPDFDPAHTPPRPPFVFRNELRAVGQVSSRLFGTATSAHMLLGLGIASFATYGTGQFIAPFFIRVFGLDYAEAGLVIGLVGGISTGIGAVVGGFGTDRATARHPAWYGRIPAVGLILAGPLYILAFSRDDWISAAAFLFLPGVFAYVCYGPTFAVVQNSVSIDQRATANSIVALTMNMIALGFGPVFTGMVIDSFCNSYFASVMQALDVANLGSLSFEARSYSAICIEGRVPVGFLTSGFIAKTACDTALAHATRWGLMIVVSFYAWAALHYFIASRKFDSEARPNEAK